MSVITDAISELVEAIGDAGIPATSDPELVLAIVSDSKMVALVGPPRVETVGISPRLDLTIPVHFACNPPGGYAEWVGLWDNLPTLLILIGGAAQSVALTIGDQTLPAYRMTASRSVVVN